MTLVDAVTKQTLHPKYQHLAACDSCSNLMQRYCHAMAIRPKHVITQRLMPSTQFLTTFHTPHPQSLSALLLGMRAHNCLSSAVPARSIISIETLRQCQQVSVAAAKKLPGCWATV